MEKKCRICCQKRAQPTIHAACPSPHEEGVSLQSTRTIEHLQAPRGADRFDHFSWSVVTEASLIPERPLRRPSETNTKSPAPAIPKAQSSSRRAHQEECHVVVALITRQLAGRAASAVLRRQVLLFPGLNEHRHSVQVSADCGPVERCAA